MMEFKAEKEARLAVAWTRPFPIGARPLSIQQENLQGRKFFRPCVGDGTAGDGGYTPVVPPLEVTVYDFFCRFFCNRRANGRASNPVPSSIIVVGSGVTRSSAM